MKQLGQQLVLLYQQSVKCGLFRKVFHNSLLVTEVFRLPTLTSMSGCCYYSCLLRTALCLPGTFSLVQTCGQLAGSVCVCVCAPWRLCVHACCTRESTCEAFTPLVSTGCTVAHVCLCTVYIGVCVCQLEAMYELSVKRAVLLPPCY